jgi:hypothetical protein
VELPGGPRGVRPRRRRGVVSIQTIGCPPIACSGGLLVRLWRMTADSVFHRWSALTPTRLSRLGWHETAGNVGRGRGTPPLFRGNGGIRRCRPTMDLSVISRRMSSVSPGQFRNPVRSSGRGRGRTSATTEPAIRGAANRWRGFYRSLLASDPLTRIAFRSPVNRLLHPPSPATAGSQFQLQSHRAVVAAHHLGADPGALERRAQCLARDEVIDAPPDVARAAVGHLAPP